MKKKIIFLRFIMNSQINLINSLITKKYIQDPIGLRWTKRNTLTTKGFANTVIFIFIANPATLLYFTYLVIGAILDRWQFFFKSTSAWPITTGRHIFLQRVMGPLEIINIAPIIKASLALLQVQSEAILAHLCPGFADDTHHSE